MDNEVFSNISICKAYALDEMGTWEMKEREWSISSGAEY